jgi:hypothetical protein
VAGTRRQPTGCGLGTGVANLLLLYPDLADDEQLRADMVEGSTDAFDLLREIERRRRETETLIAGLGATLRDLQHRSARLDQRNRAMRELAFRIMSLADLRKVELPEATLSIRAGTPKVIVTDEALIPDMLCRIKREPDKTKIKKSLLADNAVEGAVLSNAEHTLTIRTK